MGGFLLDGEGREKKVWSGEKINIPGCGGFYLRMCHGPRELVGRLTGAATTEKHRQENSLGNIQMGGLAAFLLTKKKRFRWNGLFPHI